MPTNSKRTVEREVDDLTDEVLADLGPDERATLFVELAGAGDFARAVEVKRAAPTYTYEAADLEFTDQLAEYALTATVALWELETAAWRFFYEKTHGILEEANYDRFPDADWTTEPAPENGFHEADAKQAAVRFLGPYLAWERYATDDVGVDLEVFLAHPTGGTGGPAAATITLTAQLADGRMFDPDTDIGGWAADATVTVDGEELTADELADWKYAQIAAGGVL